MPNQTYIVEIDYQVRSEIARQLPAITAQADGLDSALSRGKTSAGAMGGSLDGLVGKARDFADSVGAMGGRLADMFTGAVEKAGALAMTLGKMGAIAGVGAAAYGVAGLNSELEQTRIAIGDLLTSNGVTKNLTDGMADAAGLMSQIRKDAAALPGETRDLTQIFKMAAIPGLQAGSTPEKLEKLSANAMAFGMGVANMDSGTVARELSMLISGRAGSHNVLGLQLAGLGGDKAKAFNAMSSSERLAMLTKEFEKHAGSIAYFSNSFSGLSSTLKDNAKLFLASATSGLFEKVKGSMREANDWFDRNQDTVSRYATILGEKLADAWEWGEKKIKQWYPAVESFAISASHRIADIWAKVEPIVARIADSAKNFLGDPKAIDRIEGVLKAYAVIKMGRSAAPLLGEGLSAGKSAASLLTSLAGGGGMAGGEAAAGGALAAGVALPVTAAALAALAIGAVATAGAVDSLTDSNSKFHEKSVKAWDGFTKTAGDALDELGRSAKAVAPDVREVADEMGHRLLRSLEAVAHIAKFAAHKLDEAAVFLETSGTGVSDYGFTQSSKQHAKNKTDKVAEEELQHHLVTAAERLLKAGAGGGGGGTHIDKVEITVSGNNDPSRVALVIKGVLADVRRYPTSSRDARNYSAVRG